MATRVQIPRTIDDLPYLLIWRLDDFMPPIACLLLGYAIGFPLPALLLGFGASFLYQRYRDGKPEGYVLHALYWYGLFIPRNRSFPNPFIRVLEP